ncbi:MAG: thioredoxin family protein [Methyloligellaceae bacterium]
MSPATPITTATEFDSTLDRDKIVIAKFETRQCVICRRLEPGLKIISDSYGDKVNIVQIDSDELMPLAERYAIRGVPSLLLFKNGKEVGRLNGFHTTSALSEWVAPHLDM